MFRAVIQHHRHGVRASALARAHQRDSERGGPNRSRHVPRHRDVPVVEHRAEVIRVVALRPADERRAEARARVLERRR